MSADPSTNMAALVAALDAADSSDDPDRVGDLKSYLLGSLAVVVDTDTWLRLLGRAVVEVMP